MSSPLGPLFEWMVTRTLRERGTLGGAIVFGLIFYAVVLISVLVWLGAAPWSRNTAELCTTLHYEGLFANGIMLLLWSPSRMAQMLSREREVDTISALRLTGLTGVDLALGFLGRAMTLPLIMLAITLPVVLAGMGGLGGPLAPFSAYAVLLLLALVYHLVAGLMGLASKKAQNAGGSAVFALFLLLGLGGLYRTPQAEVLGLLGPWGALLGSLPKDDLQFRLSFMGAEVHGVLVQVPVLALLTLLLLQGLGRQLTGDRPAVVLGGPAALAFTGLGAALVALTFQPPPGFEGHALMARMLALGVLLVPLALEVPARHVDLLRGASRRDADDPPFFEERLDARTFLPGPLIAAAAVVLLSLQLPHGEGRLARAAVAGALLVTTWAFAALTFQAARLWSRDRGAPLFVALLALVAVWCAPLLSGLGLRELGMDPRWTELPRMVNPIYALYLACVARPGAGYDPVALAATCATLHAFAALGLGWAVKHGQRRVRELADSLVALPADAYDAPGTLEKTCPNGHLHAAMWATCPHCPAGVSSATDAK